MPQYKTTQILKNTCHDIKQHRYILKKNATTKDNSLIQKTSKKHMSQYKTAHILKKKNMPQYQTTHIYI